MLGEDPATAVYMPEPGYEGTDSFSYRATGPGGTSEVATQQLLVAKKLPRE